MIFGKKHKDETNSNSPSGDGASISLTVPQHYGEMSEKQLRYVAALKIHGMVERDIWIRSFIKFAGIKPIIGYGDKYLFAKKGFKGLFTWQMEEMNYFVNKMKWITRDYKGIRPPKISKLQACDELMCDTRFIQYIDAENHYQAFIFTQDANELLFLAATLYQQGATYSKSNIKKVAQKLKRRKTEQFIALFWMLGIKQEFAKKWPYLFPASSQQEDEDNEFDAVVPDMERIIRNQLRMLTKGDVTKETQVLGTLTHSALDELNQQCFEYEKLKSQEKQ